MYDTSLKRKWDNEAVMEYARQEGMEKKAAEVVYNLIIELGLTDDITIARIADVSEDS